MISSSQIKLIRSLAMRKMRVAEGLFVAEGAKLIGEMRRAFPLRLLVDDPADVERCSLLNTPQGMLALFELPQISVPTPSELRDQLVIALDCVQDPGNLGTIIRLANWFGVRNVLCGEGCADAFAPKAVQASMGALAGVQVHRADLPAWLQTAANEGVSICGTFLDGENIYTTRLPQGAVLVMGSEGHGISEDVERCVSKRLLIPPTNPQCVESLNVAMATAIALSEWRRPRTNL